MAHEKREGRTVVSKLQWDKTDKDRRIRAWGLEPPWVWERELRPNRPDQIVRAVPGSRKPVKRPNWIDGQPQLKTARQREMWLRAIELAYRNGELPIVPRPISAKLHKEIEEIRNRLDVRRAFAKANRRAPPPKQRLLMVG